MWSATRSSSESDKKFWNFWDQIAQICLNFAKKLYQGFLIGSSIRTWIPVKVVSAKMWNSNFKMMPKRDRVEV